VLMFQLAGYDKIEFSPNDITKSIDIRLKASEQSLKEVEVKGYKTERKKDVVGSLVYLNGAAAPSRNANDFTKMGRGKYLQPHEDKYFRKAVDSTVFNTEEYDAIVENRFLTTTETPLSTFSIDVDGGSYSNVRRYLQQGQLPPSGAVRIEELMVLAHPRPRNSHQRDPRVTIQDARRPVNLIKYLPLRGLQRVHL